MNGRAIGGPPALATLRQQAATWWQGRTPRERQSVLLVGVVLLLAAVWLVLVQPAWRTIGAAPSQLDRLDAQLQQTQRIAAESQSLRAVPPVTPAQAAMALKSATDRLGDKARLTVQGDRATLTLTGVQGEALRNWLLEVRSGARARPLEAQLQRGAQGFSGSLIVLIGSGA